MKYVAAFGGLSMLGLQACTMPPTEPAYSPPEASGLVGVRPYPAEGDVCQVIGENALTVEYLDDAAILVGCPESEAGAISDREAEGAQRVDQVGSWVLLSQPLR
jgi:hypothetical protein